MRHTISQRVVAACLLTLAIARLAHAQQTSPHASDPFANHRWHFEASLHGALEAANYNVSHEELYGITEGITYGLREGLVLVARQHTYYVSQRANDSWLLGLTGGLRGRVYRRGRTQVYLEGDLGISDAAIAVPPRGTRFNYVAMGSGGMLIQLSPRVHALAAIEWIHVSNNGLKGRSRNPDTEAAGLRLGIVLGF